MNYYRTIKKKEILELLAEQGPLTSLEIRVQIVGWTGLLNYCIYDLFSEGLIIMIKTGRKFPYKITEKGAKVLLEA